MKKVLSLVLVIAMVLSSMSFAFAAKFEDIADTDYAKAIETLTALGIVTGYEDGTYRPEKVVTRAEMAKLMVEILGYGDLVAGSKSNFTDTQGHWADAWIALAAGKNIVLGDGNGKFRPDATVSYDEAITMVVRSLGYTDNSNELKTSSWPTNFKIKAAELDLTDDIALSTTGADRGGVAQLLYNALTATLVTVNSDGDVVKSTTQTTDDEGKVVVQYTELLSRIADYNGAFNVTTDTLDKDSKHYAGDKVDLAPYMYQSLKVYKIGDDVVYIKGTNSEVVEGTVTDVISDNDKSVYADDEAVGNQVNENEKATLIVEDAKEVEHKVVVNATTGASVTVYYNGKQATLGTEEFKEFLADGEGAKVTVVVNDLNDNGKADNGETIKAMVATKATEGILVRNDYREGKLKIDGYNDSITLPSEDGEVKLSKITVSGDAEDLTDIVEDDVVVAYYAKDNSRVDLVVTRNTVDGEITKTNTAQDVVYIDGTKYEISGVRNAVPSLVVGSEGTYYFDNFGKVFAFDGSANLPTDYAVVIGVSNGDVVNKFGMSIDEYPEIKLATQDGESIVYKVLVEIDSQGNVDNSATLINGSSKGSIVNSTTVAATVGAIDIDDVINTRGQLVKYSVDEDGYIDGIELIAAANATNTAILTADIDTMVSEDTIVFNADGSPADYDVVATKNIKNNSLAYVVLATEGSNKGKAEVIVAYDVQSVNDGTYGVIKSVNYVTNSKGKQVQEVVALIDGVEVTYLSTGVVSGVAKTTTSQALAFSFNTSDVITGVEFVEDVTPAIANFEMLPGVSNLSAYGMNGRFFAKDCAVYIYDQSDKAWTIGDVYDIDNGSNVVGTNAYVFDKTDSTNINLVVQVVK